MVLNFEANPHVGEDQTINSKVIFQFLFFLSAIKLYTYHFKGDLTLIDNSRLKHSKKGH